MRRALVFLTMLGATLPVNVNADVFVFAGGAFSTIVTTPQVAVPDVVGEANFAAADAILEGDGLDGSQTVTCSSAPLDQVISQAPPDGTLVDAGTVVVVFVSSGDPCKGRPPLWLFLEVDR